jgi:hypothetical protein
MDKDDRTKERKNQARTEIIPGGGGGIFSALVHTVPGAHPASYAVGTGSH